MCQGETLLISLVPFTDAQDVVKNLSGHLCDVFKARIDVVDKKDIPTCRRRGGQYLADDFIAPISNSARETNANAGLGVVGVDLFVPDLNFVFGIANSYEKSAVISLYRLMSSHREIFYERARKEAVHELGHVFGLSHCSNVRCVMYFSNSLADTDYKKSTPCERCYTMLGMR